MKGFSLVELSIVLVILGLLTGGILGGRELIKAAELRSVGAEYEQYQTAINTFRMKYMALPGDMGNATSFWGAADACAGGGSGSWNGGPISDDGRTCNGNNNGGIDSGCTTLGSNPNERAQCEYMLPWHHLANAQLVSGDYNAYSGSSAPYYIAGETSPKAKYDGAVWSFQETSGKDELYFVGGLQFYQNLDVSAFGVLTPTEAWNIDSKLDDGKLAKGQITGMAIQPDSMVTVDGEPEYNLQYEAKAFSLHFFLE